MKKLIIMALACMAFFAASAQTGGEGEATVYCEIQCVYYNIFKSDVNVTADFGIATGTGDSEGWICDRSTGKKRSFASPMAALTYMAQFGWEFKSAYTTVRDDKSPRTATHYILTKKLPANHTARDVVGDICWR